MKLNKTMKKFVAIVSALAMVVAGITYTPQTVSADADYDSLTYTQAAPQGEAPDLYYSIVDNTIVGWGAPWYGDGGNTFQLVYSADNKAEDTVIKVNGVETTSGVVALVANALVKLNPTQMADNAYTKVEVTTTTGSATIVFKKGTPTSGGEVDPVNPTDPTNQPDPTDPTEYQDATDTWTTGLAWNIWAGNNGAAQYKNGNALDDYYVNVITGTGAWSVQAAAAISDLKAGALHEYTITVESDKDGAYVGTKDDLSNSALVYTTLKAGTNELKGTFTPNSTTAKLMLDLGNAANSGATIHVTGVEVKEYVSESTVEYGKNIVENAKWLGWFEAEGWANYDISDVGTGYTLTDKNIGPNWYSIQTGIDNVEFLEADYTCEFTLTASAPKKFKVDNRTNDATVFTEVAGGEWTQNDDGTYSYKYKGTFKNTTNQFINVRVSLGYFAEDENYAASDVASFTLSDFTIYAVDPQGETGTTKPTEPVELGDIALSSYNWNIQDGVSTLDDPSEYNGYGFTVSNIDPTKGKWEYGALLDSIAVTKGETYTLSFKVASTVDKVVPVEFTNGTAINRTVNATADGTEFTLKFTANADTVKIYMPLGVDTDSETIENAYDVTVSDVQFNITEPDPTEPVETLPAGKEITLGEPTFAFDASTSTKYYNISWDAVEDASKYTAYVGVEDEYHIATAFHNGYTFANMEQKNVDHVAGTPGTTETLIVVAYDAEGNLIARGIKEITIPDITEDEKAAAAVVAKFNSEDNYAKGATAIVSSGKDANNLLDGNVDSRWQASPEGEDHAVGSEYFGVDLGAVKTIGQVMIAFEASYAATYDVYVAGADGVYGETPVASGTADTANLISTVNFDEVEAQFVKVVVTEFSGNASTYGTSVYELAVFPKAEEPPVVEPVEVTGLTATQVEKELKVSVSWTESEEAAALGQTYNVYVGDTKVLSNVAAGTYDVAASAGTNTIKVTAVLEDKESVGQTTTVDVEVEVVPTVPEAATYDWSNVTFLGNGTPDANNTDMYKAVAKEGTSASIINVQVNSEENVIYIAGIVAPKMVVNGVESTEVIYNGGDQQFVKLTAFTDMYNDVQFYTADGTLVGTVYVYYKDGVDNGVTNPDPGTSPVDPGTSPVDPGTTPVPVEMTFEEIAGTGVDITRGNFTLWINTTNTMAIAVDPTDANHIQGKIVSNNNNWDQWGAVQYKVNKTGLTPGEEYTISVDLTASGNDGVIVTDGDVASVDFANTQSATLTRTVVADENGSIVLTVGAGQVGIGVVLDFSNVVVKDSQGNIVPDTPVDPNPTDPNPTDPKPTDPNPTDPKPTDPVVTDSTTTPQQTTTTATPKTTAKKALGQTKVKKATKKKAAKKVKITFRRVKGAKKYKVQISKTKKFKKILVRKTVKKVKVTIKHKKLKNKKKLYVRVRAVGAKKWSKVKRIKIKK